MEVRVWLDSSGFFKLKMKGDPILAAEGISSLMVQNKMFSDIILVAKESELKYLENENVIAAN